MTTISSKDVEDLDDSKPSEIKLTPREISKKKEKDNIISMLQKLLVNNSAEEWF